jgi:tetratricopeptide (TPR) repeat protein
VGLNGWAPADHVVPVDQAIEFFTGYIRAYPRDPHGYTMRAMTWHDHKREYDNALGDYNEAIRLNPTNAPGYLNRGNLRGDNKEFDKAISDYNEAIRLDPSYANAYNGRGWAWWNKKEYDKAIADYNEAIRLDSNNLYACNGVAWLAAACPDAKFRDGKKAVKFATKACELSEWTQAYPIGALAAAHAEAGSFEHAVKWQTTANGMSTDVDDKQKGDARLKLYCENKPYRTP